MTMPLLEARNLSAGYGKHTVLSGINLNVEAGDFIGILGPNASGKTTLIRALSGGLEPWRGEVLLDKMALRKLNPRGRARKIAVVSQTYSGGIDLPVEDLVMLGRIPHFERFQWWPNDRDRAVISWVLGVTGTEPLRDKNFQNLSGGEQQRVMIALALAQKPQLILLDEPTLHLDINYQIEIFELLRKLNQEHGLTVLSVLHDLNLAAAFSRRLVFLKEGRIWKEGPPRELINEDNIQNLFQVRMEVRHHPENGLPLIFPPASRMGISENN